jgi:hypothetical protein
MKPADVRARLLAARDPLGQVFATLDDVGPHLPEPERAAALELRGQVADLLRRLGNLTAFLGAPR